MCAVVKARYQLDPYAGHVFAFVGKRGDRIKVLYWDGCRSFKTPEQRPNCDRIVMNIGVVPPHVVGV